MKLFGQTEQYTLTSRSWAIFSIVSSASAALARVFAPSLESLAVAWLSSTIRWVAQRGEKNAAAAVSPTQKRVRQDETRLILNRVLRGTQRCLWISAV